MVRYFYAWTPLVIVGTIVLLSLPWLGLIALMVFSLVALAALALAVVFVPYMLSQAIRRRWHGRSGTSRPTAAAARPVNSTVRATRSAPATATALVSNLPSERDR